MRLRYIVLVMVLLAATFVSAPERGQAQDGGGTCEQVVQSAISDMGINCANLGANSVCYGYKTVKGTLVEGEVEPDDFFGEPGYQTELTLLKTVSSTELNTASSEWGIGVMNVQANIPNALPDETAVYLLIGDVEITNEVDPGEALLPHATVAITTTGQANVLNAPGAAAGILATVNAGTPFEADGLSPDGEWVRVAYENQAAWVELALLDTTVDLSALPLINNGSFTPMQAFQLRTGWNTPECTTEPPSVLAVQSPTDIPIDIRVNGIDLRIDGTVFLRVTPDNKLQIITGSGTVIVFSKHPNQITLDAGTTITIPLDGSTTWTDWRIMSQQEWDGFGVFETIPGNVWVTYVNPDVITASAVGTPIPIVVTEDGQITPVPPFLRTFPVIDMSTGTLGEEIERTAWVPFSVGAATCPNWILYHSNREGDWDIFRLGEMAGAVTDNISQGAGSADLQPSYTVDGEWVVFASNRDMLGGWEIYVAKADGTEQIRLTYNTAADINPVWGPTNQIAFESNRDGNWELYVVDVATDGLPVRLTEDDANDINAFWLPDGEHIAFQSDRDGDWEVYVLSLVDGEVTQLTDNETQDQEPIVSNDGKWMAWLQLSDFGVYDLWLMNLENGETQQLTDLGTDVGGPEFAPDSTFLAFHANVDGDYDVFAVEIETGNIKLLTDNDAEDRAPSFRCGTSDIVYHSDVAADEENPGQREIFQVNPLPLDGPMNNPTRLTTDVEADDIYPLGDPREELNSREGYVPSLIP